MRLSKAVALIVVSSCLVTPIVRVPAQAATNAMMVTGVAYDSLRGAPLAGAFITVAHLDQQTTSDSLGIFHLTLARGSYAIAILHPAFDSVGLTGTTMRTTVTDGRDTLRLFVPSFASLWRIACSPLQVPRDSGLVFGTVRTAEDGRPLAAAMIAVTWIDISYDKSRGVSQRRWRLAVASDSVGGFALCGMPPDEPIRVTAWKDSATAGAVELQPNARRVQRRDLFVARDIDSPAARGAIEGVVRDEAGQPIAGARITTDGSAEVRSGADGRFLLLDAPIGTREMEVLFVGRQPTTISVDVLPRDTARVEMTLRRVTALPAVRVNAPTVRQRRLDEINERRESKMGHYMDSTVVERYATFQTAITSLVDLKSVAAVYVDGVKQDDVKSVLRFTTPATVAVVEEHMCADVVLPLQFRPRNCGGPARVILIWTKYYLP